MAGFWREVGGKVNTSHFAMTPCGKQGLCSGDEASCSRLLFVGRVPVDFHICTSWVEGGEMVTCLLDFWLKPWDGWVEGGEMVTCLLDFWLKTLERLGGGW